MPNPESLYTFDEKRNEFKPYGLTCELWMPDLMRKPDRHNEIELNYFTSGSITYLFQGSKITIPGKSLSLFWKSMHLILITKINLLKISGDTTKIPTRMKYPMC